VVKTIHRVKLYGKINYKICNCTGKEYCLIFISLNLLKNIFNQRNIIIKEMGGIYVK